MLQFFGKAAIPLLVSIGILVLMNKWFSVPEIPLFLLVSITFLLVGFATGAISTGEIRALLKGRA
jgi:hypothetical protein